MLLGTRREYSTSLARSVAALVIAGAATGCSSGIGGLTDGLTTNSTGATVVAQANQPYPGEKVVRPKATVGNGTIANTAAEFPSTNASQPVYAPAASQPVYTAAPQPVVSSSPLPPPSGTQNQVPTSAAASAAAPAPAQRATEVAAAPRAPEPSSTSAGSASGGAYTVVAGDTLYGISRKTGAGVEQIKQANGLADGSIRVGQKLVIPGGGATTVAAAAPTPPATPAAKPAAPSTSSTTANTPVTNTPAPKEPETPKVTTYTPPSGSQTAEEAVSQEKVAALPPETTGVDRLRWPVRGRVIAGYGAASAGKTSDGIDIAVPEGTSVHAAENGVVIYAGDGLKGFGNTILVRHENGLVTVYGHNSQMNVKRGDTVRRGQQIALSGMSGDADRPKLHFEVRKGTSPVDPMTYLE